MRHFVAIALLATACTVQQPLPLATEFEHAPGQRALLLNLVVHDADSVGVTIICDGERIHEDRYGSSFQLKLGACEDYQILMRAGDRLKRLSIHELSDDLVEVLPMLEVDMDRTGNLVLVKPSNGKDGFELIDVGMSRERP